VDRTAHWPGSRGGVHLTLLSTGEDRAKDPKQSPDYGRVINRKNFDRLAGLIGSGTVAAGGQTDPDELYIAPTVLVDVPVDSPIMQEEVFGPILPVLEIDSVEAVIDWVNERPRPLGQASPASPVRYGGRPGMSCLPGPERELLICKPGPRQAPPKSWRQYRRQLTRTIDGDVP
jgi:hypothetical protein